MNYNGVASRVSKFWSDDLQGEYKTIHCGNIKYKVSRKPVLSEVQAIVFEEKLTKDITKALRKTGYLQVRRNGVLIEKALNKAGVDGPLTGEDLVLIEDDDIYYYSPGMNGAKMIRK